MAAGEAALACSGVAGSAGKLAADMSDDATLNAPDAAEWNAVWPELQAAVSKRFAPGYCENQGWQHLGPRLTRALYMACLYVNPARDSSSHPCSCENRIIQCTAQAANL